MSARAAPSCFHNHLHMAPQVGPLQAASSRGHFLHRGPDRDLTEEAGELHRCAHQGSPCLRGSGGALSRSSLGNQTRTRRPGHTDWRGGSKTATVSGGLVLGTESPEDATNEPLERGPQDICRKHSLQTQLRPIMRDREGK